MSDRTGVVYFLSNHPLWTGEAYATRVLSEAAAVRRHGVEVGHLRIVAASAWRDPRRLESKRVMKARGQHVIDILQPPDRSLSPLRLLQTIYLKVVIAILALRTRPAILHAQGMRAGGLAGLVPSQTPVIVDVHGDVEAEAILAFGTGRAGRKRARWARADSASAVRRADAVVSVSRNMTNWLRGTYPASLENVPIVEIVCGVDPERFDPSPRSSNGPLEVVYLGGLQAYQPAPLIAAACKTLAQAYANLRFKVITPSDHHAVRSAFAALDLEVAVVAAVPAEVPSEMRSADIGIVPRIDDQVNRVACPTKIGEYLAAGVPVACSEYVGGWADWLESAGVGFSLQSSSEVLAMHLDAISQDRASTALRCRAAAEASWSWDCLGVELRALYSDLGAER